MAAYAALVSLMRMIHHIQSHPSPPISLDRSQIQPLIDNVSFLQAFLEGYTHHGSEAAELLESRIADASYTAEDIIESHLVDQIGAAISGNFEKNCYVKFYQSLQKVKLDMDSIKRDAMKIEGEREREMGIEDQLQRYSSISAGSFTPKISTMVGFDNILYRMMGQLVGGQSDRQILPVFGMGGIGKTSLARNICRNQTIVQHFDIIAWVTVSQECSMREVFVQLILCVDSEWSRESLSKMSEVKLGEMLYKRLWGRRYLITVDDLWSVEIWDEVQIFFPDNSNSSRIMITTRLSKLASLLSSSQSHSHKMRFLDEDMSWDLLCKSVFGEESCPLELVEHGKKIAKNCIGLPLSIVVIGLLLAKYKRALGYWDYIAENLNSIANLEDDERCLKILYTSY